MNIEINPQLFKTVPDLKLGINYYTKITVSESPQMLKGRLQLFQEHLFFDLENEDITEIPSIHEWRKVSKAFGDNPNLHPYSTEALMRRIAKQDYLSPDHSATDLNNFFSLQYVIPISIYDRAAIQGDVSLNIGNHTTSYDGLNRHLNTLDNRLALTDDTGAFGSPYGDSIRTKVSHKTTEALHVFYLRPSMETDEAMELVSAAGKMFTTLSGGNVNSFILHAKRPSILVDSFLQQPKE